MYQLALVLAVLLNITLCLYIEARGVMLYIKKDGRWVLSGFILGLVLAGITTNLESLNRPDSFGILLLIVTIGWIFIPIYLSIFRTAFSLPIPLVVHILLLFFLYHLSKNVPNLGKKTKLTLSASLTALIYYCLFEIMDPPYKAF